MKMIPLIQQIAVAFAFNNRLPWCHLLTAKSVDIHVEITFNERYFNSDEIDITVIKHNFYGNRNETVIITITGRKIEKRLVAIKMYSQQLLIQGSFLQFITMIVLVPLGRSICTVYIDNVSEGSKKIENMV